MDDDKQVIKFMLFAFILLAVVVLVGKLAK